MRTTIVTVLTAVLAALPCYGDLVHHYPFNSDASDVVGRADGTLLSGASVSGGVLTLDGLDDFVQIGQKIVPTSGSYSVALFARQTAPQSTVIELISQGFSLGPGFYLGHFVGSGSHIRASDSWQNTGILFPTDGLTHHFALTVDSSAGNSKFYLDGSLSATLNSAIATTTGGSDTRFGRQFDPFDEYFAGLLDDIRIYNHALSALEVATLAAIPEPTPILLLGAVTLITLGMRKWFRNKAESTV